MDNEQFRKLVDICTTLARQQRETADRIEVLEYKTTTRSSSVSEGMVFGAVAFTLGGTILLGILTNNKADAYREALQMQHKQNAYVACLSQPPRTKEREVLFGLVRWTDTQQPDCKP